MLSEDAQELLDSSLLGDALERAATWVPPTQQVVAGSTSDSTGDGSAPPFVPRLVPERWRAWGIDTPATRGEVAWDFTAPPQPSACANHGSARQRRLQLGEQFDSMEQLNFVEYCPPHMPESEFVTNVNALGAVDKPDGGIRLILDPTISGVNSCMRHLPLRLPTAEQALLLLRPTVVLGKRDLKNGFYHIRLAESARKHMGFRHPVTGRLGRYVVLPFGAAQSPPIFCEVTEQAARIFNTLFQQAGLSAFTLVYVDDFLIIADSHADMQRAFSIMDEEAARLGLQWNAAKDVGRETPLSEVTFLGLTLRAPTLELSLPEVKRQQYLAVLQEFEQAYRGAQTAPRKQVERLAGKLAFAARCCRWGMLFLQNIFDGLYPTEDRRSSISLTEAFWHDLEVWQQVLGPCWQLWMGRRHHSIASWELVKDCFKEIIYTDASKTYGVGAIKGGEVLSVQWGRDRSADHIGLLELEAIYEALRHWRHDLRQRTVVVYTDNTQALAAVNKASTRLPETREVLWRIAKLGLEFQFELRAVHVKGADNPADAPSRGQRRTTDQDWTFRFFSHFNSPPAQVDCCAAEDGYNVQPGCTHWYSAARPVQEHVAELVGKVLWANIPFALADVVLDALVAAWQLDPVHTVATVVVPDWPTAGWYRKYLRRRKPLFRVLHRYPTGSKVFLKRNTLRVAGPCPIPVLVLRLGGN